MLNKYNLKLTNWRWKVEIKSAIYQHLHEIHAHTCANVCLESVKRTTDADVDGEHCTQHVIDKTREYVGVDE